MIEPQPFLTTELKKYQLSIEQIENYLPHRYPFILVDRVDQIIPVGDLSDRSPGTKVGVTVKARKCISRNEPFFNGHFPGRPVMPGVLILEALAQTACFSLYPYYENDLEFFKTGFQAILLGANDARFRKPVVPGDVLELESVVERARSRLWSFKCVAKVAGEVVAEANLLASFDLRNEQ